MPTLRPAPLLALAAASVLAAVAPLDAQEPAPAADTVALEGLTVQVLRTPLAAERAPFAVSARGPREVRLARPGLGLDEALPAVPGVQVDNRFNWALGERISIRGFGARAQFGVRGVRVLVDGIPATLPDGQTTLSHLDPGTVDGVEVVRGPASALYGNASGGVILFRTLDPPDAPLAAESRAVAGSDGLLRVQGTAGGRSGGWAYRATATRLGFDGFREHARARSTHASGRVGWRGGSDEVQVLVDAVDYEALNPGSLSRELLREDRGQAFANNVRQQTGEEGRQAQVGVRWQRRMGPGALEVSAYGVARAIDNPIPPAIIDLERRAGGARLVYSGELGTGPLRARWTAGGEVSAQRDDRRNFRNVQGQRGDLTLSQEEAVTGTALFAQAVAPLSRRVDVLAALRWDRHRFRADDRLVGDGEPDDSGARTMDAWSPALGLSLAASDALVLYANVATAFETPTTTELANRPDGAGGFNPGLEPQRTVSVEAGMKGDVGRVAYTLAAYRARVRDALVPFEVEGAAGRQFFRNAGSAVHRGVEASLAAAPVGPVTARLAYTWTDARFDRFAVDGQAFDGNRVPGVAPHRVEGQVLAAAPAGPFAGLTGRWVAAIPVDDANEHRSPAYTVLDLRSGWQDLRAGRLRATPYAGVTNLLDRDFNTSVTVNAFGGRYYEPGPGRSVYLGVDLALGG